ncbi:uncharacterized protein LOC115924178 [Strongylocentrotus purpuratus]|uniref:SHSP domain-containing protein n=1 Tax=Strongylocentrotus purpuratus TaxID=7668 RepID=A0A7M7HD42_STRPU|nr:uncharacterized protein LOC576037 [Strongylocentrotus purpuratus]XP_030841906.1 uncharacterized protein LOC115924178 [Strongylocentrotus purpuratus]|eukprot:XP_011664569.1 PREDICTED: uncharacterized protein LOC576037 [Strongylocentrotus purpuratus]
MNIEIRIPFSHPRVEYSVNSGQGGSITPTVISGGPPQFGQPTVEVHKVPQQQSGGNQGMPTITVLSPNAEPTVIKPNQAPPPYLQQHSQPESSTYVTTSQSGGPGGQSSVKTTTTTRKTTERRVYEDPGMSPGSSIYSSDPPSPSPTLYQGYYVTPVSLTSQSSGPPKGLGERQTSKIEYDSQRFQVTLDVSSYRPEDIEVKIKDNKLTVRAEHREGTPEGGFVQREYYRQYTLPDDVDLRLVKSYLSEKGILTLEAPKLQLAQANERTIPIQVRPHVEGSSGKGTPTGPIVEEFTSDAESLRRS